MSRSLPSAVLRALLLAALAFAIIGPLANLVLWSFAERWYFPFKLPVSFGLRYWEVVFRPTGVASGNSIGNRTVSSGSGFGSSSNAFGGGGFGGNSARSASSRGGASMGGGGFSGGGRGGGGGRAGGGGGRRR